MSKESVIKLSLDKEDENDAVTGERAVVVAVVAVVVGVVVLRRLLLLLLLAVVDRTRSKWCRWEVMVMSDLTNIASHA